MVIAYKLVISRPYVLARAAAFYRKSLFPFYEGDILNVRDYA